MVADFLGMCGHRHELKPRESLSRWVACKITNIIIIHIEFLKDYNFLDTLR